MGVKKLYADELSHYEISVHRAVDSPKIAEMYRQKQIEGLSRIGVKGITSSLESFQSNPHNYLFLAHCQKTKSPVCGMSVIVADLKNNHTLPMAYALESFTNQFDCLLKKLSSFRVAEACGWWIDEGYNGKNLAKSLLQAGIYYSKKIELSYLFGLPHQYTISIMNRLGFTTVNTLNKDGFFPYPDERYQSSIVELNLQTLHTMVEKERNIILSLLEGEKTELEEVSKSGQLININYKL